MIEGPLREPAGSSEGLEVTFIPELLASRTGLACTRGSRPAGSIVPISEALAILPLFVIPITVISNSSGSRALITEAADVSDTSCSPDLPPKIIPNLVFRPFAIIRVFLGAHFLVSMLLVRFDNQSHQVVSNNVILVEIAKSQSLNVPQNCSSLDKP